MNLQGKRVLVTGGGTGTGADFCRGFIEAGAEVVIAGRRREPLEKVAGDNPAISVVVADVTEEESVRAMFEAAGPVDIVIANAGRGRQFRAGQDGTRPLERAGCR